MKYYFIINQNFQKMNYYIIDVGRDARIYVARSDDSFMNFLCENIDIIRDVFIAMQLTNSKFKNKFPDIFDPIIEFDDDLCWNKYKVLFCRELKKMSFGQFIKY